ncbi:MAG: hypothetical protein COV35_10455 [Alphaproteobacteria bacterium CG11_big_fil_rev_8_21_14_0_20_39_49]|nr:MAG: hypothetical protein COV35_10455 [Alphaproteobacteria bacterium CG11_big_fil_rev_8_21_14_0_20_39_49]
MGDAEKLSNSIIDNPIIAYSYKDLKVWQKSRELVKLSYEISSKLPENEKFGRLEKN